MKTFVSLLAAASLILPLSTTATEKLAEGTVKRIDAANQRVMLAHGPIPSIGMGPMTMMFRVKDAALLKSVKEGDKVRFQVEKIDGSHTVVRIEAAQ